MSSERERIAEALDGWRADLAPTTPHEALRAGLTEAIAMLRAEPVGEPVGCTLYRLRCGWCGAYEGTVDPTEPCAKDHDTGEYIGPHQFEIRERAYYAESHMKADAEVDAPSAPTEGGEPTPEQDLEGLVEDVDATDKILERGPLIVTVFNEDGDVGVFPSGATEPIGTGRDIGDALVDAGLFRSRLPAPPEAP